VFESILVLVVCDDVEPQTAKNALSFLLAIHRLPARCPASLRLFVPAILIATGVLTASLLFHPRPRLASLLACHSPHLHALTQALIALSALLRDVVADVARFLAETVHRVKGISVGIVILVLNGTFRGVFKIAQLRLADVLEFRIA